MSPYSRLINFLKSKRPAGESQYHFRLAASDLDDDDDDDEYNRSTATLRTATDAQLPTSKIILLNLALGGLQFFWSTIMANLAPFLRTLGLSKAVVAASLICQPLSGTLLGPWVGAFSDGLKTQWGRRRPVMIFGAVSVTALLLLLAWIDECVRLLTCQPGHCGEYEPAVERVVQGVAVTLVVVLSIAVQPFQSGARSVIIDNVPAGQQSKANATTSRIICIGSVAGFLAGTVDLPSIFKNVYQVTQLQGLAVLNAVVVVSSVATTCLAFEEPSHQYYNEFKSDKSQTSTINIWRSARRLPKVIRKVCLVQFFAWLAWFSLLYYTTTYISELADIVSNGGNPVAVQHEVTDSRTLRTGIFASLCFAVVALFAAVLVPVISAWVERGRFGSTCEEAEKESSRHTVLARLWVGSQAVCGILMLTSISVASIPQGVLLIALLGVPWAVTQWVPLAIIGCEVAGARHEEMRTGTVVGIHNMAVSAPQILAGLIATIVYAVADTAGSRVPTSWVLALGGCASIYASRLAADLI